MDTTQVRETQIESIISKACGKYRAGDSYTFEDVWKCVEVALASIPAEAGQVPKWREVAADERPAATRLREQFEAEHGDMAGVMQA